MKFDKIMELINEKERKLSELTDQREALMLELANSTERLEKDGTSSYEEFKQKRTDIEELNARLDWLNRQIAEVKKETPVSNAEIYASWNAAAEVFGEELKQKLEEYQTAKGELFKLYSNLVHMQNDMLHKRRAYGKLLGIAINGYFDEPVLGHLQFKGMPYFDLNTGMSYKGFRFLNVDTPFFLDAGFLSSTEATNYNMIVGTRTAKTLEDEKEPGT